MQLERPRFRQDLVAEPIEDGHTRFIDVMDPNNDSVFRFYEVEYSLACAMDGERDVPGIMRWAQEELGLTASANEVKSVIATLGDLGYLDGAAAPAARPEAVPAAKPSIWDPPAPAARPADDEMLGRGVVVGQKRVNTPVPGVELGHAGASAPAAREAKPPAADIELAAGVTTGRGRDAGKPKVDDIALGVPGRVDVSVDLSDQVAISTKDVKEAVRASKVMNAVEIPDDLKNALDSAEGAAAAKPRKPPPTPAKGMPAMDPKAAEKVVEATNAAAAKAAEAARAADAAKAAAAKAAADAAKAAAKPLPKPVQQPEAKPAVQPPPPEMKVSRPLLILLIVVAVGAAVFFVYKFVLDKSSSTATGETTAPIKPPEPPKPPPPPAPESEKLAASAPMSESIKPVAAGTIEMIAGPEAKVKEGDTLVRFTGAKALDTEISALDKDIEQRVKTELFKAQQSRDAAIAAGNKAAQSTAEAQVADRQKSLDDKQGKLATKKSDRDKLEIKSPAAGAFTAKAKVGTKVTPTDELGMLVRAPTKTVTFKKAEAGPKSRVILVTKDGAKLSCVVTSADATGVVIECPEQDAAVDGAVVTFGGVDTSPAPTPDTGSASETGSAGSAAPAAVPSPAPTRPRPPARQQPKVTPPPVDKGSDATTTPPPDPAPAGSGSAS